MIAKVLVVEDEPAVRELICFSLKNAEFECDEASNAETAQQLLNKSPPNVIIMDWMLPGKSGIELTRELKTQSTNSDIPVIMLTARGEEDDVIHAFECGAEDYIIKPFSPRELVARIRVILRRVSPHATDDVVEIGSLRLNPASRRVEWKGEEIHLGSTEFRLLQFLMTHRGRVYSRSRLLDNIWGTNVDVDERTVVVYIRRLRQVLEPDGADKLIQTVRGSGYRFEE